MLTAHCRHLTQQQHVTMVAGWGGGGGRAVGGGGRKQLLVAVTVARASPQNTITAEHNSSRVPLIFHYRHWQAITPQPGDGHAIGGDKPAPLPHPSFYAPLIILVAGATSEGERSAHPYLFFSNSNIRLTLLPRNTLLPLLFVQQVATRNSNWKTSILEDSGVRSI